MKLRSLIILIMFLPLFMLGQHNISGTFSPAEDFEWILLYKVTPEGSSYVTKATLDSLGTFSIDLDSTNTKGMYKIVYNIPQEQYNFDIIYDAKEDVAFTFNNETGIDYTASSENKLLSSYSKSLGMISQSIGNFFQQQSTDTTALETIFKTLKETQLEYENLAKGKMVETFIKANKPYTPEQYEDAETYISNIKKHYFDHVDFDNELLQSSSFLVERMLSYVFGMSGSEGLSDAAIYKENFIEAAEALQSANPATQKMIYHIIWQQLAEANYEELANFIADDYLIDLASSLGEKSLVEELEKFKRLSRGATAPDFDLKIEVEGKEENTKLSELAIATNYILVFWSSTCSHCLEELPQLHDFMKGLNSEEFRVIAFGLEDESYRWESTIYQFPDFIHAIGLGKWDNETAIAYNIESTPTYFILDSDKKILAKPADFMELKSMFVKQ
ncbi:MAG: peroxiredoxin family protein [bacterium]